MSRRGVPRPRSVFTFCATRGSDHVLAEALVAGVFLYAGVPHDLGGDPLWGTEDWQRSLATFSWGLDLANVYRETAETRFLDTWERLVLSFIDQSDPTHESAARVAMRVEHWIAAWIAFAAAPAFRRLSPGAARRLLASIQAHLARLADDVAPDRRSEPAVAYGVALTALAFPHLDADGALLGRAINDLGAYLADPRHGDGVLGAGPARQAEILRPLLGLFANAGRFSLSLPPGYGANLEHACEVLLHSRPLRSVAGHPDADVLAIAARLFERQDFSWAATHGTAGIPPLRRHVSFGRTGIHVQRSPWGNPARFALFECGTPDVSSEPLRLTLDLDGQTLVMRGGTNAAGEFVARQSAPGIDVLQGRAVDPGRDVRHDRRVAFVGDQYWLVSDRLHAGGSPRHELRFELDAAVRAETAVMLQAGRVVVIAPGLRLVIAAEHTLEVDLLPAAHGGVTVAVTIHSVSDAAVTTLVMPEGPRVAAPTIDVRRDDDTTVVVVGGTGPDGDASDWIGWSSTDAVLELGEFRVRASGAWLRQTVDGKVLAFGSELRADPAAARAVAHVA